MGETINLNPEFQQRLNQLYGLRERWEQVKNASPVLRESSSDFDRQLTLAIDYTTRSINLPHDSSVEELTRVINTMEGWLSKPK